MAENVEDIEAKLAAYVDGELTPAEKVEIETHLEQNPSHRALLHDLGWHRQLLRNLPREKAPGDCTEGLQGQLERDVLLGGDELTRGRSRFRINYSPQLLSAAAIIILAVGLAIVVYSVLPPHQPSPRGPLAQVNPEPGKTDNLAAIDGGEKAVEARAMKRAYPSELAGKKGTGGVEALSEPDQALGQKLEPDRYATFGASQQKEDLKPRDMMVITVTADDVKGANETVLSYLSTNHIYFADASTDPSWKDGVQVREVARRSVAGYGGGGGVNGTFDEAKSASATSGRQENGNVIALRTELERARPEPARPAQEPQLRQTQESIAGAAASRSESFAKAPTTQPTAIALGSVEKRGMNDDYKISLAAGAGGRADTANAAGGSVLLKQQQQTVMSLADADNGRAKVILARNMNDQQVRELAASLSQPERGQFASVSRDFDQYQYRGNLGSVELGDRRAGEISSLKAGTQEREMKLQEDSILDAPAAVPPATQPATGALTTIRPLEAGITRAESDPKGPTAGAIAADKLKDASFAFRVPTDPLPAQQPAFSIAPTTQPLPGLQTFNCVIVVKDNTLAAAKAPATQPTIAGKPSTVPAATAPPTDTAK